jgi:serine/threonine protein kinase
MYDSTSEIEAFFRMLRFIRFERKLGEGGFGVAFLVYDEIDRHYKVIKLPREARMNEALREEAFNLRLLDGLLHDNIIRLYDCSALALTLGDNREEERFFLKMQFGGTSLRERLGKVRVDLDEYGNPMFKGSGRWLPVGECLRIAIDTARGLEAVHGFRGAPIRMIHRDISPDNVLIDNDTGVTRLTDFGIARVVERTTSLASFAGKLIYMAPEVYRQAACMQSDIYSLGIVLYEMLTGELPFINFDARMKNTATAPSSLNGDIPKRLDEITMRCLETDVEQRYASASELLTDLNNLYVRLKPLPSRLKEVSRLPDGRRVCHDSQTDSQVIVRVLPSDCTPGHVNKVESYLATMPRCAAPWQSEVVNKAFMALISPFTQSLSLSERFPDLPITLPGTIESLCRDAARMATAVQALHTKGLAHGMLSPFNATFPENADEDVVLHDVGAAGLLSQGQLRDQELLREAFGPLIPFLSPQLLDGNSAPAASDDVYSIGAILFYFLTGQPPLTLETCEKLLAQEFVDEPQHDLRSLNAAVPRRLARIIEQSLQYSPDARPVSIDVWIDLLSSISLQQEQVCDLVESALQAYPPGASPAQFIQAHEELRKALELEPGSALAHRGLGIIYFRNGAYRFAVEELERALRVTKDVDGLELLGKAYEAWNGQYAEAAAAYSKALQIRDRPRLQAALARCWHAQGRTAEARDKLELALAREKNPTLCSEWKQLLDTWAR